MRRIRFWESVQLRYDLPLYISRKCGRSGNEEAACIGCVLSLCQQVRSNRARVALTGKHHRFRRSRGHINRAVRAHNLLGSSDIAIPRATYFLDRWKLLRSIRQRRNCLRAADPRKLMDAEHTSRCEQRIIRAGANRHEARNASDLRRYGGHYQRGKQRETPAGNIAPDGIEGANELADADTGLYLQSPILWELAFRNAAHILSCVFHGVDEFTVHAADGRGHLFFGNPQPGFREVDSVEFLRPLGKRAISAPLHVGNNPRSDEVGFAVVRLPELEQVGFRFRSEFEDTHQSTILFRGYSTMPCAFAAFSRGRI